MAWISNAPLREAFLRSEVTARQLADTLGYTRTHHNRLRPYPDASTPLRALGLQPYWSRGGKCPPQKLMREDTALRYAEALGLDPWEIGL